MNSLHANDPQNSVHWWHQHWNMRWHGIWLPTSQNIYACSFWPIKIHVPVATECNQAQGIETTEWHNVIAGIWSPKMHCIMTVPIDCSERVDVRNPKSNQLIVLQCLPFHQNLKEIHSDMHWGQIVPIKFQTQAHMHRWTTRKHYLLHLKVVEA